MRKDGSEFPIELIVTRPELPGPPVFCGYLRDVTEQGRSRTARAAPRRRSRRRCGGWPRRWRLGARARGSGLVTEEVARLLGAHSANLIRYDGEGLRDGDRRLEPRRRHQRPPSETRSGLMATPPRPACGAPAWAGAHPGLRRGRRRAGRAPARVRLPLVRWAVPMFLGGTLWGAGPSRSVEQDAIRGRTPSSGSRTSPSSPRRR